MENKTKFKEPDYKAIQKLSHRMDCVLYADDFNTYYPNKWVDRTLASINRYLIYGGKI